ncbi:MAG: DUF6483 family protein [Oscillospiraceae bacterium]|jgi:hypothetical protein|nr:DUF6483 family protein [Oscillospiraceae bacterium]
MYGRKQDWMERQIEAIGRSLAAILFGKDKLPSIVEKLDDAQVATNVELNLFNIQIDICIKSDQIKKMEKLIFETINSNKSWKNLIFALTFYNKVMEIDKNKLKKNGLSTEEIKSSIQKLRTIFEKNGNQIMDYEIVNVQEKTLISLKPSKVLNSDPEISNKIKSI